MNLFEKNMEEGVPTQWQIREQEGFEEFLDRVQRERDMPATDPELKELADAINREGPLYFIRENGELTVEPWIVDKIFPVTVTQTDTTQHMVYHIRLHPVSDPTIVEEYALGDFDAKRRIHPASPRPKG